LIIKVKLTVSNIQDSARRTEVEALVDTGSVYTWVPSAELEKIGLTRAGQQKFRTIDGDLIERPYGWGSITVDGASGITRIVFGEPKDGTVLGSITMEDLGIKIDPQRGTISREDVFLAY
jgi:predicted aspartyl protease